MDRARKVAWATDEADRLEKLARSQEVTHRMGSPAQAKPLAASALEFLKKQAKGEFYSTANAAFDYRSTNAASGLERTADVLLRWVTYVESGMAEELPFEVQSRLKASTELMEQVADLLRDRKVHPAAPVVLAGAALEEHLRGLCEAAGCTPTSKSISSYIQTLRTTGACSAQDVKDVTAWAGQRNEAAHGEFDRLSRDRAQIMVDGINLFMRDTTARNKI